MVALLGKLSPQVYALMRIAVGLMFFQHGGQKILGLFGGMGESGGTAAVGSLMFFAGLIELLGGLFVAVGFKADIAAFLSSGQMAVAYFMSHASRGLFPIQNRGELAVVYAFVFLYIAVKGSGIWSVDACFKPAGKKG